MGHKSPTDEPDRAMMQRILGSHTPPCHRRMVVTTLSALFPSSDSIELATLGGYRLFLGCLS